MSAMERKTVLLLPSKESSLKEMLFFSRRLEETGRYRCVFVIKRVYQPRWLEAISRQGHQLAFTSRRIARATQQVQSAAQREVRQEQARQRRRSALAGPKALLQSVGRVTLLESALKYWRYLQQFRRDVATANRLLDETSPALVVTAADRTLGLQTALLASARKRGIPSLVIPWAVWFPDEEHYARTVRPRWETHYGLARWTNRYVARKHPHLVIAQDGQQLLFRPGEMILAAEKLGILPPSPLRYTGGSGMADFVAVESRRTYDTCLSRGVPPATIAITGRVSSDDLYSVQVEAQKRRGELKAALGAAPNQPIILCAVPNSAEQKICSWDEHWRLTEMLFAALASFPPAKVILNLHPKSRSDDYRPLAEKYGATICEAPIEHLIPLCDLFVSTNSSTVVMAVGCGKPVVNLEIYGIADSGYKNCPGVTTVRDEAQVLPTLRRLMTDRAYYDQMIAVQKRRGADWILLDGQCGKRMIEIADRLVATAGGKQTFSISPDDQVERSPQAA